MYPGIDLGTSELKVQRIVASAAEPLVVSRPPHEHDAAAIGYAVLEGVGVGVGLADRWTSLAAAPGEMEALALVGRGAVSPLWTQLSASILGVATRLRAGSEAGGALGAARLAWLADGGSDPAESERLLPRRERLRALDLLLRDEFAKTLAHDELPASMTTRAASH